MSHESALSVHNLSDVDPAQIHLTVPPGFGARDPLVVVHIGTLTDDDVKERRGWTVTTPIRTLIDVAASDLSQEHLDKAVNDALTRGQITRRLLLRRTADLPPRPALRLERALARLQEQS